MSLKKTLIFIFLTLSINISCDNLYDKRLNDFTLTDFISIWNQEELNKASLSNELITNWFIYEIDIPDEPVYHWFETIISNSNTRTLSLINHCNKELNNILLKNKPLFIKYFQNPTEEEQLIAINKNISSLIYIKEPTPAVQLIAIKKYIKSIEYIKEPTPAVFKYFLDHK